MWREETREAVRQVGCGGSPAGPEGWATYPWGWEARPGMPHDHPGSQGTAWT